MNNTHSGTVRLAQAAIGAYDPRIVEPTEWARSVATMPEILVQLKPELRAAVAILADDLVLVSREALELTMSESLDPREDDPDDYDDIEASVRAWADLEVVLADHAHFAHQNG